MGLIWFLGAALVGLAGLALSGCGSDDKTPPKDDASDVPPDRYDGGHPDLDAFQHNGDAFEADGGATPDAAGDADANSLPDAGKDAAGDAWTDAGAGDADGGGLDASTDGGDALADAAPDAQLFPDAALDAQPFPDVADAAPFDAGPLDVGFSDADGGGILPDIGFDAGFDAGEILADTGQVFDAGQVPGDEGIGPLPDIGGIEVFDTGACECSPLDAAASDAECGLDACACDADAGGAADAADAASDSAVDSGPADAGVVDDAAGTVDGGGPTDGGAPVDSGFPADAGVDGGAGADVAVDAGIPPPVGINLQAASFGGPVADLDPTVGGGLIAFGGMPSAVHRCQPNGIGDAVCTVVAEFPAGIHPINSFSTPFGYALAIAAPAASGNPIDLFRIDEAAIDPALAVEGHKTIDDVIIPGLGYSFMPTFPLGIAAYHDLTPAHDRLFIATRNEYQVPGIVAQGVVLCAADSPADFAMMQPPVFSPGLDTSALVTTQLTIGGVPKTVLVALNAGRIDPADAYTAGISVFDPDSPVTVHLKTIALGEVAAAKLAEMPLDASGTIAYVVIEAPQKRLVAVNLQTNAVATIPLGNALVGETTGLDVEGTTAYIADASGRIVFVDIPSASVLGFVPLPEPPTALTAVGPFLYVAAGHNVIAIDPALVELQ